MLQIVGVLMLLSLVIGMMYIKIKRGYMCKGDIVSVSVTVALLFIAGIAIFVSIMGYIISFMPLTPYVI